MPRSANRASTHGGGQWSTTYVRERCSMYFRNGKWNRKTDGDIVFIDGIGFTGIKDELRAAALGLLRDREAFDREDGNNKNSELFTRSVDPKRRVSCIINCISAKQVVDKNPDIDRSVKAILQFAKELFADNNSNKNTCSSNGDMVEIPVVTVITQCDLFETEPEPIDLMLQDMSARLKPIYRLCRER